ncbi:class 3 adenylate cyclase [Roseiarcus fermentans]|uniref:Class 3 adenylate cyclase n=1 Tax=Roseiarcus fermentans TaxID=1473586 RepID=A0A366EV37_9HYPH|nr:adenylate/guanylate cyclase domain-containing protein [Roseiarcus fermentans]RBP06263.1 class 3 adenylate cyclase [Roseiarcus fermentans]
MRMTSTLAWLVDDAADAADAGQFLAALAARLVADRLPLAGGALVLDVPHPLVARRAFLWRSVSGDVIERVGFASEGIAPASPRGWAARRWLAGVAAGPARETPVGRRPDGPTLAWVGPRPFTPEEEDELDLVARFSAAPLSALAARATLTAALEAYIGRRSAARVLAAPLRRDEGETIAAALLYADLRAFTALSESQPAVAVIAALNQWFERIAGAVHAYGGEVLKFIGDGVLAIFPVVREPRVACDAAISAVSAARLGMAHLDTERRAQGLPALPFGAALHLGEMVWGNIGAADRLDFTAIGPAVNLVSRLEGLCRPLHRTALASGALAAETDAPLSALGTYALRGIPAPCAVFALPELQ